MAKSIVIFIDSRAPLDSFVNGLESLLGNTFQRVHDNGEIWYEFKDQHIVLTVGTHEYENSRNMNFQGYRYDMEVRALNVQTEEERKQWRLENLNQQHRLAHLAGSVNLYKRLVVAIRLRQPGRVAQFLDAQICAGRSIHHCVSILADG